MKIKYDDFELDLNIDAMSFNETNLNEYLKKEHGSCAFIGHQLSVLEYIYSQAEDEYESLYNAKFVVWKDEGGSDALINAKCKSDPELIALKAKIRELKKYVTATKSHMKAWDKAHENAQSFGHNLRKEMDKLGNDIYRIDPTTDLSLASDLDAIMRKKE